MSEQGKFAWHDTELSSIVERAYHAVALDEYRAAYDVALWTSPDGDQKPDNLEVEQRWFIGAHANVGGGYGVDPLADLSLQWMMRKASAAGLKLEDFNAKIDAWKTDPVDSFKEFLGGVYAWFRKLKSAGDGRFVRRFSEGSNGLSAVNVTVDESVWIRWGDSAFNYRPPVLTHAGQQPPAQQTAA